MRNQTKTFWAKSSRKLTALGVGAAIVLALGACASSPPSSGDGEDEVVVGIITKNATNPYWVAIANGAKTAADEHGVELISAVGKNDTDNASQVAAIENMMTRGVSTILITPADSKAIVPAIKKARDAGIQVIALDAATDPADAVDATFATDHVNMGVLIGQWAKAKFGDEPVKLAMLDADPQSVPGLERHEGFLKGFGIEEGDSQIVGVANSHATIDGALSAMETLLQKDPDINLVYTVSEPAGYGAHQALANAGKADSVTLVTLDGSCEGIRYTRDGRFAANSQQYPGLMAEKGIEAAIEFVKSGEKVSGTVNTGEALVTADVLDGIESLTLDEAASLCWGE